MGRAPWWVALVLVISSGCGGGTDTTTPPPATPTEAAPSEADPLTEPIQERDGCDDLLVPGSFVEARLEDGTGDVLRAAEFPARGRTPVALVLLHQTDAVALCGWGPFAAAAAREGVPSLAFDLCGYGDSDCSERLELDPAAQVDLAVSTVVRSTGAERVVVVGASMGGANAVVAAADGADVAGWVDVSGPDAWFIDRLLVDVAPQLRGGPRGLVVFSRSEGAPAFRDAQKLARRSGAAFVDAPSGHGWELLTDDDALTRTGRAVLDFATG